MTAAPEKAPWLPPRWFIRLFWAGHRAVYRITGGRIGLRRPKGKTYGMMRLHTIGRRSGAERIAIVGYYEDGPNLVTMAMNGWGDPEPAWWLNLQANPDVTIELPDGPRAVHGYAATGEERRRLWAKWAEIDDGLDGWAALRSRETAVVVFEPRSRA
jgi:deazaflavin-dependent oxidoreductase (nitroreductase family)